MAEPLEEALASTHRYKLRPPLYDGNFATFEEWKYKFTAYMGLVHKRYPLLLEQVETATQAITDTALRNAGATMEEAEENIQLAADLRYILNKHHFRHCGNSLQTTSNKNRIRDIQATYHTLHDSKRRQGHWLPNTPTQTNI